MNPHFFQPKGPGPVAWCNRCSRKHRRRDCNLVTVHRKTKRHYDKDGNFIRGGKPVTRLAHPRPARKKSRARRT